MRVREFVLYADLFSELFDLLRDAVNRLVRAFLGAEAVVPFKILDELPPHGLERGNRFLVVRVERFEQCAQSLFGELIFVWFTFARHKSISRVGDQQVVEKLLLIVIARSGATKQSHFSFQNWQLRLLRPAEQRRDSQ